MLNKSSPHFLTLSRSARLGVHQTKKELRNRYKQEEITVSSNTVNTTTLYRGKRNYELSNHLGNVNVVISDKRKSFCDVELGVERFEAEVLSGVDYYPFGKMLPDRQYYASNDTSQFINGFNGMRYDHEFNQKGRSIDYGARILDVDLGRWLSRDPLSIKYPSTSNYGFAMNSPLMVIDIDGNDNIIYLVVLSSAYKGDKKLSETDVKNIITEANQSFKDLGLKTEVRLVTDPDFDPQYIQISDRVAVIGKPSDVKSYIKENLNSSHNPQNPDMEYEISLNNWNGGENSPELSQNVKNHNYSGQDGGVFIAIDAGALSGFGKLTNSSIETAGAYLIMHGLGHTIGINHNLPNIAIMTDGGSVVGRINGGTWISEGTPTKYEKSSFYLNLKDFMNNEKDMIGTSRNDGFVNKVKERLGNNKAEDNYERNKSISEQCE